MIRILITDDHAGIRLSITRLLNKQANMAVVGEAENGARALEFVERYKPDILLLDIEMPVMTGIQVAQKLAVRETATKIIILSNYADREFVQILLGLGVHGYLRKEDAAEYLTEAVCQVHEQGKRWLSPALMSYAT
jgi:YesN/AraC family two-component response regulator